jgi:cholesterol oxidase
MGVDQANGSVSFRKGRLDMRYDVGESDLYRSIFELFDALGERSGRAVKFDRNSAVTAHAMGGCAIGASPHEGVIDGEGQVYENEGLYISDASALPAPTGGPPSLTIAAWSSHVAASLLRNL